LPTKGQTLTRSETRLGVNKNVPGSAFYVLRSAAFCGSTLRD
jgi:hypothetical protein